jgi:hypothetical protein
MRAGMSPTGSRREGVGGSIGCGGAVSGRDSSSVCGSVSDHATNLRARLTRATGEPHGSAARGALRGVALESHEQTAPPARTGCAGEFAFKGRLD